MYTIGLDVHQSCTSICILGHDGRRVKRFVHRGHPADLPGVIADLGLDGPARIGLEASCGSGTLCDLLKPVASEVVVAHPGHLRLIFHTKKKNDRVDAEKIAKLLYLDELPAVHVPDPGVRAWRELIIARDRAVAQRTRVKNALRSLLRSHQIRSPRSLWSRDGLAWLAGLALPTAAARLRRDILLDDLDHATRQVLRLNRELDAIGRGREGVALLMTIPGVGPRTAEAVCAFVDDPHRFGTKTIGSYLGLVPRQDQSGKVNRLGHITRAGPPVVRRLLTEVAWKGLRHNPTMRGVHERIMRGDRDRRKIALVATTHYLARVMLAMLQSGEVWRDGPEGKGEPMAA